MHDYINDPNWVDIPITAGKIAVILTTQEAHHIVFKPLAEALDRVDKVLRNPTKDLCKQVKTVLIKQIDEFIKGKPVEGKTLGPISQLDLPLQTKLNLMMTVARWPEFYMVSESEMRLIGQNIEDHISEINAIIPPSNAPDRPCPYSSDYLYDDRDCISTMKCQEQAVKEFLSAMPGYKDANITAGDIASVMQDFVRDIDLPQIDHFERGFIQSILYIRKHSPEMIARFRNYRNGMGDFRSFSLSESKGPISDNERAMQLIHSLGFRKPTCPMILENLFHYQYPTVGIEPQQGQVLIMENGEMFFVAPGLGPAMKIRFVFNCHADIQNLLSAPANLIQSADRLFDPMEAYNNQMGNLLPDLPMITDAFCTDATGYSDFLTRGIYEFIMRYLYRWPDDVIQAIMRALSMPVKVGKHLYPVPYGSLQGVKLLVFIMNHANRLMGIISRRLSDSGAYSRSNAGDDVECHKISGTFKEKDIMTEIAVFAYFNCPTNVSKSAWLARDGRFDFCSKHFTNAGMSQGCYSITGIPPKIVGKQMCLISNFSEMFKVLDVSRVPHRSCLESWEILFPILEKDMKEGAMLPNRLEQDFTLERKISIAKEVFYGMGGLADYDNTTAEDMLKLARYRMSEILQRYRFDASGVFALVNSLDETFKQTPLYRALGTVNRQGIGEIIRVMGILNSTNPDEDDISEAIVRINNFERNIAKGTSISRNISTYHRRQPRRDTDVLLSIKDYEEGSEKLNIPIPKDLVSGAMMMAALSGEDYTDIDNIRIWIEMQGIYAKHPGCIVDYYVCGKTYWALVEGDKRIRLTSRDSNYRYKDNDGFKWPEDIQDPELRRLYDLISQTKADAIYCDIDNAMRVVSRQLVRILSERQYKQLGRSGLDMLLRQVNSIIHP